MRPCQAIRDFEDSILDLQEIIIEQFSDIRIIVGNQLFSGFLTERLLDYPKLNEAVYKTTREASRAKSWVKSFAKPTDKSEGMV